jgi:hypothetical protein
METYQVREYTLYICLTFILSNGECIPTLRGRCDRDRIIIGFTTTYAISVSCKFESRSLKDLELSKYKRESTGGMPIKISFYFC